MKKPLVLLLAAILVLMTESVALAVPSKTTNDIAIFGKPASSNPDVVIADNMVIGGAQSDAPLVVNELNNIIAYVKPNAQGVSNAVIEYFPAEVQQSVAAILPDEVNLKDIQMNEMITLKVENYAEAYQDVTVEFQLVTPYKENQSCVVIIGIYSGELDAQGAPAVEWIVLPAEVSVNGTLQITYPADVLVKIQHASSASMAILSNAD